MKNKYNMISVCHVSPYKIDLASGVIETDGTHEDHERVMSALELMARIKELDKASDDVIVEGGSNNEVDITIQELGEQFLNFRSNLSIATVIAYRNALKELDEYVKKKYVKLIKTEDINGFQKYLEGRKNTARTIDNKTMCINSVFNFAVKSRYINRNPVYKKSFITKEQKIKEQWAIFNDEEISLIFNSDYFSSQKDKDPDYYYILLLAVFTGCRVSELTTLLKSDFKVSENGVNYFQIRDSKTLAGVREVPIYYELWKVLKPFIDSRPNKIFKYVERDGRGSGNAVGKKFSRHMKLMKVEREKLVFHSLRKFLNNTLKNNDVDKGVRCQLLGHENKGDTNGVFYEEKYTVEQMNKYLLNSWGYILRLVEK